MLSVSLPGRLRLGAVLVAAVTALGLLAAPSALAQFQVDGHTDEGDLADLDSRSAAIEPSQAQLDAVEALGATARWNAFGTPQSLIRHGGFLASGIQGAAAEDASLAFVDANRGLFRLTSLNGLEVDHVAPLGTSASVVVLRQVVDGLPVSPEGVASVGVVRGAGGWNVAYVSSTLVGSDDLVGEAELGPAEALGEVLVDAGAPASLAQMDLAGVTNGWQAIEVAGLREAQLVRKVAFPTPKRGVRVAYETYFADGTAAGYRHFVDAESGRVLYREDTLERLADNPSWEVFPAFPLVTKLNGYPWSYPSTDTRETWCWEWRNGCDEAVANVASPLPWDVDPATGLSTNTTIGNNATSSEAWGPGSQTGYRPTSATRDYTYPWTNVWFDTGCDPANFVVGSGNDIDAAVTNLFVMHNRMHDWSYNLGFTEPNWNGQQDNFGNGGAQNDPLIGRAQAGAVTPGSRDNANMSTRPDGISSLTNMFLWQPLAAGFYAPCVDGDYDMAVIGHEFGHMVENRMIGKGGTRSGQHAGAMGESSGDLLAMEYLNEYRFVPVAKESPTAVGPYATGNPIRAIRNYDMAMASAGNGHFPSPGTTPDVNPLNFSDVAYDIVGEQVHADGEIWSATNFDIRELFLHRYPTMGHKAGIACANGEKPVTSCEGNRRWIQIMLDAYLLMPTNPTFLDARDAYLAADMIRFGGANQDLLWRGFASRGFGQFASVANNGDEQPIPSWESPLEDEATLEFVATDEAGNPVDADVYVGHHEARVTPIDDVESFVVNPEGYVFVAKAPGHGFTRFWVRQLVAGKHRTITIEFAENWSASANGATATGDGADFGNLIDETEATNWVDTTGPVTGDQVTIDLGGAREIRLVRTSAYLQPGQNRFTALRQFELHACTAGADAANPACDPTIAEGWTLFLTSPDDSFPATPPRPVSPALLMRTFQVHRTTATHVRFVVLTNQCIGNPAFLGDQDLDPNNNSDCAASGAAAQVRAAELQLLSHRTKVHGAARVD